jgi:hypothetical protein
MDQEIPSGSENNNTKFDSEVLLTRQQFSDYWETFPFRVRRSINRTKKGELPPCSEDQLKDLINRYLKPNECGSSSSLKCAE